MISIDQVYGIIVAVGILTRLSGALSRFIQKRSRLQHHYLRSVLHNILGMFGI